MAYETLINDVAGRFGLGPNAAALVNELVKLIGQGPGGIGGFVERLRTAGLGSVVASWLGASQVDPISAPAAEQLLGSPVVDALAAKVGLSKTVILPAIGYLIPKLIAHMTPGGTIPAMPAAPMAMRAAEMPSGSGKWLVPVGLLAAALALYALFRPGPETVRPAAPVATVAPKPAPMPVPVATPAPAIPAAVPPATLRDPYLALSNDNGILNVAGIVHDDAARTSLMDALRSVFGADKVRGNLAIDPGVGAFSWFSNLRSVMDTLHLPGIHAIFAGNTVGIGGLADIDRNRIVTALSGLLGPNARIGSMADKANELIAATNGAAQSALAGLGTSFAAADLVFILNRTIVNFATASAEVPADSLLLLKQAAARLGQLPAGTKIEIAGYTDNTGDPAANVTLSQQRADAVLQILSQNGAPAGMLSAKGYGSANPVASNDTPEGRFRNRRIEFTVN